MAEYYPLLSRAVAGLRDGAPEARQAIYGRARQALIGQLRGMQPPVPEEAITKEITALDEAINRIEAELVPPPSISDVASSAVEAALLFDVAAEPSSRTATPADVPPPLTPAFAEPPRVAVKPPTSRALPPSSRPDRPVFTPRPNLPGTTRPVRQEPPRFDPVEPSFTAPDLSSVKPEPVDPPLEAGLPAAPTLETVLLKHDETRDAPLSAPTDEAGSASEPEGGGEARQRDDILRPAMPRQPAQQSRNLRVWIVAVAALAAVVVIALTAWKLRDNPQELARVETPAPQAESNPSKIVERADGTAPADDDVATDATAPAASSTQNQAHSANAPQAATPVPAPSAGTTAQPASDQTIPVSYKAAVLVAAPDTPEKVRTYVGSVVWRMEGSVGQGATAASAVRADVDVPEAKLQMTMEIRKNTEAQFPASHTIDIKFTPAADSPIGAVKQIDVPQMRREDAETGDPLVGVPVTITNNSFLVGLTRGDAEARNVEAMRTRGWFDIPMVLADGKPAKITFEKGASGDRILAEDLTAWGKN